MANESMISLNVNLGNTKNVTAEFNALVKVLESKKIKLDIDTTSLQASLKLASSEIEKSYSKIKDTVKKANDEISKPSKGNNSGISELEKQITNAEKAISKFTETKNKQLNNILAGNNGTMIPNLTEYETLVTKMNELQNMKLDSTNVSTYATNVKEVQKAYDTLTTKIKQVNSTAKEMNSSVKMDSDIVNKVRNYNTQLEVMRQKNADIINNPIYQQIANDVNKLSQANQPLRQLSNETNTIDSNMKQLSASMTQVGNMGNVFTRLGQSIKSAFSFMSASMAFYQLANQIREIPEIVRSIDTSLTELQKTSDLTGSSLKSFTNEAYNVGETLARTGKEVIDASSEFSKSGYGTDELLNLSEAALLLTNVGDGITDVSEASGTLISAMKGFGIESSNVISIVDKINAVSNSTASNFEDISFGLERMSGTLGMAGASIDQTIGLFSAAQEVLRNSEIVSSGLNSVFMRMRGLSEDTGEAVDGLASKLEGVYDAVDIDMTDENGQLRETFDVLNDLSEVWSDLSINRQQYIAQESAGTRQSKVFLTLMNQWDTVQKSINTSLNSTGSAMQENERYLNSINGKISQLKSAWEQLATSSLSSDTFKVFVEGLTSIVKFVDSAGGLVSVLASVVISMTALKVISSAQSLTFAGLTQGAKTLITSLFAVKTATDVTTVSTIALSAAQKTLIGAAIIAGVLSIAKGINYMATSAERAEQKIVDLRSEISDLKNTNKNVADLADRYEELSRKAKLSSDEQQELLDVQNQLKEQIPQLSGYYDTNGNFIATNTEQIRDNIQATDDLIAKQKELLSDKQSSKVGFTIEDVDEYTRMSEEIDKYIELKEKLASMNVNSAYSTNEDLLGIGFSDEDVDLLNRFDVIYGSVENAQSDLSNSTKDLADSIATLRQQYSDIITSSDEYKNLSSDQQNAITESIKNMSIEELKSIEDAITNNLSEYINNFDFKLDNVADGFSQIDDEATSTFEEIANSMNSASASVDILSTALSELQSQGTLSDDTMGKLSEEYPKIFEGCVTASEGIAALNKQLATNKFDETTDDIASLVSILDDLKSGNGITASSFKKLTDEFPELLGYMSDEATLSDAISEKMNNLKETQKQAYSEMLMASDDYYSQKINSDSAWVSATESNLNSLLASLGSGYNVDLTRYKNMEDAKATITSELLKELGNAWASYFGMIADGMSLGDIESSMYINGDESLGTNMNYEAYNQAKKVYDSFQKIADSFANFEAPTIKVGGTKSSKSSSSSSEKYAEYIDSIYDSILSSLQEGTDKVDRQIAISQSKLENLELFGNQEEITKANAELETLYQDRIDIMKKSSEQMVSLRNKMAKELQATGYEEIKGLDLTNISQLGVDKIINKLEKQIDAANKANDSKLAASLTYKKNLIQDYTGNIIDANSEINSMAKNIIDAQNELGNTVIENIKRVTDLDKQRYDDKLKLIELEQMYMNEDSKEYKAKEQEKISMLIELQKGYQASISQLKAQGKSEDQEDVREYINLYTDAEIEILNVKKAMAEKERQLQIKTSQEMVTALEKQKKALEDRTQLVIDMIKKEQELKKKAINEEIDGYSKIIEARKKSITDEQDETSYNEELSEKQKVVTDLESKLLALQNDNSESAKAQRLKLEEELAKARKDVNKLQLDKITDDRLDALDEELEAFKDEKQEELDEIEDYLSREGQIRSDAMKRIEQEGKSMYNSLKRYNAEYGSLAESELESLWETATTSVNGYIDSNKSLLEIMRDITNEINKQNTLQKTLGTDNWQTFVPSAPSSNSTTNDNKNLETIKKMMDNANTWKTASKDKQLQLSQENQSLGSKIGAFYDQSSGIWYTDSTRKKKLFDTIGVYHSGGIAGKNMSVGGVSINPNTEIFSKLMIGEPITTQEQASNFITKSLPNLMKAGKNAEITLNIAKLIDVGKLDNSTDIEGIVGRAVKETMKQLNNGLSSIGLRPNLR